MGPLEAIIILLVYFAPIGFVANYAQRKGYNWYIFALLGLLLTWVLALVIALLVEDKRTRSAPAYPEGRVERLKELAALRESGALTEEEFTAEKARIISSEN